MFTVTLRGALGAAALSAMAGTAAAHVTLERPTAVPNTAYRGVLQVNHGCRGAGTTAISVSVPPGVIGVRPMPKPGWTLAIRKASFAKPYKLYGETLTEGPQEITWSGGTLPDDQYDEFTFTARITDDYRAGDTLPFPVVQTCGDAVSRWTETPALGQSARDLKSPAPAVTLVAAPSAAESTATQPEHDMAAMGGTASPAAPDTSARGPVVKAGALTVEAPWIRATPGGAKVAGGYLRVTNTGTEPDRLLGTSVPIAGRGEVHEMSVKDGVMHMAPVPGGIEIKPGETIELKPGGLHLMFMDLSAPAKQGETITGTLTFAKAGTVPVTFAVGGLGAQSAPASR